MPAPIKEAQEIAVAMASAFSSIVTPPSHEINVVMAVYSMAVSDISSQGRLHLSKSKAQKALEEELKKTYEAQKGRYSVVSRFSSGKILDGVIKTGGLYLLQQHGFIHNMGVLPAEIFDPTRGYEARNMIVTGVSSVFGQGFGTGESAYQGTIQSKGTSEIEAARLHQTASTEDTRRFQEQSSSTNQTYLQAMRQAAEGIKPR